LAVAFAVAVAFAFLAVIPQRSGGICFSTTTDPSSRPKRASGDPALAFPFVAAFAFALAFLVVIPSAARNPLLAREPG
jgi:hypothetical protein